jgi:phosphoglucosamine mutase
MLEEGKPLSELASAAMQRVPQVLENATFPRRVPLEAMKATMEATGRVERELGARGRILVRWSGTEPKLRVMVEGEDEAAIAGFAKEVVEAAKRDVAAAP